MVNLDTVILKACTIRPFQKAGQQLPSLLGAAGLLIDWLVQVSLKDEVFVHFNDRKRESCQKLFEVVIVWAWVDNDTWLKLFLLFVSPFHIHGISATFVDDVKARVMIFHLKNKKVSVIYRPNCYKTEMIEGQF